MKASDRSILIGLVALGLVAAFWFLVLSPKRNEAADLGDQVAELQAQVADAEASAAAGEQAKKEFDSNYRRVVYLGEATPADADTPSLLTQLQVLSTRSDVSFQSIALASSSTATATSPTASASTAGSTTTTTGAASESAAALMPLGATVGAAGLPVMPYDLQFTGGFFDVADFFGRLDGMVYTKHGDKVVVDGRLLTIDGFNLTAGPDGFPNLTAEVAATSYLTPADQGVTAGATPDAPGASTATPASDTATDPSASEVSAATVAN